MMYILVKQLNCLIKEKEFVINVMDKEAQMYKLVKNAKVEE